MENITIIKKLISKYYPKLGINNVVVNNLMYILSFEDRYINDILGVPVAYPLGVYYNSIKDNFHIKEYHGEQDNVHLERIFKQFRDKYPWVNDYSPVDLVKIVQGYSSWIYSMKEYKEEGIPIGQKLIDNETVKLPYL